MIVFISSLVLILSLGFLGHAADTTTVLVSDINPSLYGQAITFTATVTPTPDGGTVTFKDNGVDISGAVALANGVATYLASDLAVGEHAITAEYSGHSSYTTSTSEALPQLVERADTSVSVTSSVNPSVTGESVTFTATVSVDAPGSGTPTGTVSFYTSGNLIATSDLSGETTTCSTAFAHIESPVAITAYYSGDANFNPSDNTLSPLTQTVNKASTTTSITPGTSSWLGEPYAVSGTVTVTSPGTGTPTGTVTVSDGAGASCAANLVAGAWSCTLTSSGTAGTRTLTAVYEGDENFAGSTGITTHTVSKVTTTLAVTTAPNPSSVGEAVTITATATTVSGGSPTGTVSFSAGATLLGSAVLVSSGTDQSKAVLVTTEIPLGTHTITATYPGEGRFEGSSATTEHTVDKRPTTTKVFGSDTGLVVGDAVTGTVTVTSAGTIPTGEVTLTVSPSDAGSPTSWTHTLAEADGGQFTFTYTPSSAESTPHTFTAEYEGDDTHEGSTGSFEQEIIKRATDVQLILDPPSTFINQPITVKVLVEDNTTAGLSVIPQGTVAFDDAGKNGAFSQDSVPLDALGRATVTYTPAAHDAGMTTITATYSDADVHIHKGRTRDQLLTVNLRPTEITWTGPPEAILVNEQASYTVTVSDISGAADPTPPAGTLNITKSLEPTGDGKVVPATPPPLLPIGPDSSQAAFVYWRTRLDLSGDFDVLLAVYEPTDGIHALSGLGFAQAINRRFTKTELDCSATPGGYSCAVTVKDDPDNAGTPSVPQGKISDLSSGDHLCTPSAGTCSFSGSSNALMANVTVQYEPDDGFGVHMTSTASENVDRAAYAAPGATGDPANPPANAINIHEIMMQQTKACGNAEIAGFVLDGLSIAFGFVPDPIIGAGFGVISGTTIPLSDILQAITDLASLALDIYISIACSDTDGDGLYDLIEKKIIGTDPELWDTDGDGLGDGEEIDMAGGWFGGSACPSPLNPDSDGDGLMDGWESTYGTDPCNPDTDGDGVGDGIEVSTRLAPTPEHGFVSPLPVPIGPCPYTFFPGFTDPRMWSSPLLADTDGDGLSDYYEIGKSCVPGYSPHATYGPFVAMADSDGDGLSDYEEVTAGGNRPLDPAYSRLSWSTDWVTIGDSFGSGEGWTDPCNPDTDGDGLSDGVEVGLWGWSVEATTENDGVVTTIAALDYDMDRDGLLDGPEHMVYGTDPLHWDTDGDRVSDAIEVSTSITPSVEAGFSMAKVAATGYGDGPNTFFAGFADPRMWSNPLIADTDGDGLSDWYEIGKSCSPEGITHATYGPFVAMADSDGDGLSDHAEVTAGGLRPLDPNLDPATNYSRLSWSTDWVTIGDSFGSGEGWTDPCNPDTDGDGLSDGVEVGLWGWTVEATTENDGVVTTVAALDYDMDRDGLLDGPEHMVYGTDPLHWDTDGDKVSDAIEVSTSITPSVEAGFSMAKVAATGYGDGPNTFFAGFADPRMWSNPLIADTDGDGLSDWYEIGKSCSPEGITHATYGPFVAMADSDGDGLSDHAEVTAGGLRPLDPNLDPATNYSRLSWSTDWVTIGDSWGPGSGWPDPCNPDTDGDGLSDGVEVFLWGWEVTARVPDGHWLPDGYGTREVTTIAALDSDMDQDGLSDFEEHMTTGTDPLHWDTDGDRVGDADELIAIGGAWPNRQFRQESDPLNPNTDGDYFDDWTEWTFNINALQHDLYPGTRLGEPGSPYFLGLGGEQDTCPYVNRADSDDDGVVDGAVITRTVFLDGEPYMWVFEEGLYPTPAAAHLPPESLQAGWPGMVYTLVNPTPIVSDPDATRLSTQADPLLRAGRIGGSRLPNVCNPDSDGDGVLDGVEVGLGTDPGNWDTDGDGLSDGMEVRLGTCPFTADTDKDGLLDSAEVLGENPTNPLDPDTDADGLCDGGARTPYMLSDHPGAVINPRCLTGIGGHPNPSGIGENERGDGRRHPDETDPNNPDTDGDAVGDGIEVLGFSVNRQHLIPTHDSFGRPILVTYPSLGCMDPLNPDTDGDGLLDGEEDLNHDGHFDFHPGDFDIINYPGGAFTRLIETNPCDPDTDGDGLDDWEERHGIRKSTGRVFPPTNPLDHDTDNDWLLDGEEVDWICEPIYVVLPDPDAHRLPDAGVIEQVITRDDIEYVVRYVPYLDPTNRDSVGDGWLDGLSRDPCNSEPIPIIRPITTLPVDTDGDGFSDEDEIASGTDPFDPDSYPVTFTGDLDLDGMEDDRLWLVDADGDGKANVVFIDIDSNTMVDARVGIRYPHDLQVGDFNTDGEANDCRYVVSYTFADQRLVMYRWITLVIYDYGCDLVVNQVEATE